MPSELGLVLGASVELTVGVLLSWRRVRRALSPRAAAVALPSLWVRVRAQVPAVVHIPE